MKSQRNLVAPLIASVLLVCALTGAYAAAYIYLCNRVAECEPDLSKSRVYSAEWIAVAFRPAAMVEGAFSAWTVKTEVE